MPPSAVTCTSALPPSVLSAETTQIFEHELASGECVRLEANATLVPQGDQRADSSSNRPEVICLRAPAIVYYIYIITT